jgi:GntP family gluconate:H+ symporter
MTYFFIVLVVTITLLVLMIVRFKVHPVLALFVAGIGAGVAYSYGWGNSVSLFMSGFGGTLGGVGCTIIFGSIIAMGIQDSGATKTMVNFFVKLFKGKNMELSTGMAGFIIELFRNLSF